MQQGSDPAASPSVWQMEMPAVEQPPACAVPNCTEVTKHRLILRLVASVPLREAHHIFADHETRVGNSDVPDDPLPSIARDPCRGTDAIGKVLPVGVLHADTLAHKSRHKDVAQRDLLRAPPHHVVGNTIGQLCDVVKQGRQLGTVISDELQLAANTLA